MRAELCLLVNTSLVILNNYLFKETGELSYAALVILSGIGCLLSAYEWIRGEA